MTLLAILALIVALVALHFGPAVALVTALTMFAVLMAVGFLAALPDPDQGEN